MQDQSDIQLLRDYAATGSEAAFRELVTRHTDFVFSAALRQVNSPDLAADLAQSVFTDLARKARPVAEKMLPHSSLAGWLHRSTRYAALNHLRDTRRRQSNERQAMEQLLTNTGSAPDWEHIRPVLDEALDSLADDDREALLLRYFKNQDFRAIGVALGTSDDTAQKRVTRAVDRLRDYFSQRRVTIGASGLVVLISANSVQAAPAGLATAITTTALAGTAISNATILSATKTIAMTTLQKALVTATVTVLAGAGIYQAHRASMLEQQNESLVHQQAVLAGQIRQLQLERDNATNRLTTSLAAAGQSQLDPHKAELLRLRGEVASLRNQVDQASDPIVTKALRWKANVEKMKLLFAEHPEQQVPEMKLLSDDYFFDLARDQDLETSNGVRQAFSEIRQRAKNTFAFPLQKALKSYIDQNDGRLPDTVAALKSYFDSPVDDAMLDQYKLLFTGKASDVKGNFVLKDKQVIDPEIDDAWEIGPNAYGPSGTDRVSAGIKAAAATLQPVMESFQQAHGGAMPTELGQLKSLINTPEQQAAYDQLSRNNATITQPH